MYKILKSKPWRGYSPLNKLNPVFFKSLNPTVNSYTFKTIFEAIRTLYDWIAFVLERIDVDLYSGAGWMQGIDRVVKGEKVSYTELPPHNITSTNVDIVTLIIFLNILMDDLARLFRYLIDESNRPKTRSYSSFKEALKKYEGKQIQELNEILDATNWYSDLKYLRDFSITHRGDKDNILGVDGERVGIYLGYVANGVRKEEFVSNLTIDDYSNKIYEFLVKISDFLEKYVDEFPLTMRAAA